MFGVGLQEMALIAIVAVLVFGPDRIPEMARQAGRFVKRMKSYADAARDDLRQELGPDYADLELRDLDPRTIVRKHILEAMEDEDEPASLRAGLRPLEDGELPPYDVEAT